MFLYKWLTRSCLFALVFAGNVSCLQATDAKVACQESSGSSTQAVLPAWKTNSSEANAFAGFNDYLRNDSQTLSRTAGMGGLLAWGSLQEGVSPFQVAVDPTGNQILDSNGTPAVRPLFRDDLNQCTVHLTAATYPKVVVWTSLNCVDWSRVTKSTTFWLSTNQLNQAVQVTPSRTNWPQDELKTFGRAHATIARGLKHFLGKPAAQTAGDGLPVADGAQALASVVNFDRFVVTIVGTGPAQSHIKEKLTAVQSARAAAVQTASTPIQHFLRKWIELTEAEAVLKALSAFKERGCALGTSPGPKRACTQLFSDLKDEYNAAKDIFRLNETDPLQNFDAFIKSLSSVLSGAPVDTKPEDKFYWASQKVSFHRKKLFADFTRALHGAASGGAGEGSSQGFGFGLSNILFLHAMIGLADVQTTRQVGMAQVSLRDMVYQALPLDVLFKFSAQARAQLPAVQILDLRHQTFKVNDGRDDFGGVLFRSPTQFDARDEGAMISFQGYYPMAFLSHPDMTMGNFPSRGPQNENRSPITYHSSSCQ